MEDKFYFAPMEGITGYVYRTAYQQSFPFVDKYFIPFLQPSKKRVFSSKELNDILPEHNPGIHAVPQLLTNKSEEFLWAVREIADLGYREVNLNLGCPSKTVVSKGKGAGLLADTDYLMHFLDEIFRGSTIAISIKTRLGKNSPDEFYELMEVFGRFPVSELIIHPRVQTDYYKNQPNLELFEKAVNRMHIPLCYNGDLCTPQDYEAVKNRFADITSWMFGRGLLRNPGLLREICTGVKTQKEELRVFHDSIYHQYQQVLCGEKPVLFKMKELWSYLLAMFGETGKYGKQIKKAERLRSYEEAVNGLFATQELVL